MGEFDWIIYGAYGYTGRLIAERAVDQGMTPVLAGRSNKKLKSLASRLDLEYEILSLENSKRLTDVVSNFDLVYHAAGPFIKTSEPMIEACISGKAHYMDITGEIPVFKRTFEWDRRARSAGIALISGMGFDVVPTDCLASFVASRIENPRSLEIAIDTPANPSSGTLKSVLEMIPDGGYVRDEGQLHSEKIANQSRIVPFPGGKARVFSMPLGDLVTAWHSTGSSNITTYLNIPTPAAIIMKYSQSIATNIFKYDAVKSTVQSLVEAYVAGPDSSERTAGQSCIWAYAENKRGHSEQAWLVTGEPYRVTIESSIEGLSRIQEISVTGAVSPSMAFGEDFVLEVNRTRRITDKAELSSVAHALDINEN